MHAPAVLGAELVLGQVAEASARREMFRTREADAAGQPVKFGWIVTGNVFVTVMVAV